MKKERYKDTLVMGKKPYAFVFLCIFISCAIGAYTLENIAFVNTPNNAFNNNLELFMLFGVNVVANAYLFFLIRKYFSFRINFFPLILFFIAFICNIVALCLLPNPLESTLHSISGNPINISFSLSNGSRVKYALLFGLACYYGFMIFSVFPKVIKSSSSFMWLFYVGVFVCLFSIVYSLVKEWDIYVAFVTQKNGYSGSVVSSCYNNRNTFGTMLLLGIVCLALIQSKKHCLVNYILMFVFYIELFFCLSKTSIIISTIFIISFLLYRFIIMIKPHPARTIIGTIFVIGVSICFVLLGIFKTFGDNSFFANLLENFKYAFNIGDNLTFTARTHIWEEIVQLLRQHPLSFIFGFGEYSSLNILSCIFVGDDPGGLGYFYAHNGVLQMVVSGGFIRLAIGIILIVIFLYKTIKNAVSGNRSAVTFILVFIAFCLHSFSESTFFFPSDTKGMALCFLVMLPCLVDYERKEEDKNDEKVSLRIKFESSSLSRASLVVSLLLPIFIFIGPFFGNISSLPNQYFPSLGKRFYLVALLSLPYIFSCLYLFSCLDKKRSIFYNILSFVLMLGFLTLNFFVRDNIVLIVSLSIELFMVFFAFIRCYKPSKEHNLKGFFLSLIYLSIFLAIFGIVDFGFAYFPKYSLLSSPSYVTYLSFFNIFLYFLYICLPTKSMVRPLDMHLLLFEYKLEYIFSRSGNKIASKNEIYYLGKKRK